MKKKKKRKVGNTAGRTMGWLRDRGYLVAKVERWNPFAHIRQDLFGFIDIVAIRDEKNGVLGVQATHKNFLEEHKKLFREKKLAAKIFTWLAAKNRLWLIGWEKTWKGDGSNRKVLAPILFQVFKHPLQKRLVYKPVDMTEEV